MYGDLLKTLNRILHDDKNKFEMNTTDITKQKRRLLLICFW